MALAFKFDEFQPKVGSSTYAFRTHKGLVDFVKQQGEFFGSMKFWEIKGKIISDDGSEDGIQIKVDSVKEVFLEKESSFYQ